MNFTAFTQNIRSAWMITPEQAALMMPVLKGIIAGHIIEAESNQEPFLLTPQGKKTSFAELSTSEEQGEEQFINVTYLQGTMLKHDGECGEPGTRTIGAQLLKADKDPQVIGHIIIAESGGGASNSVPEIAEAITQCTKPVVTYVDGIAGSACMYAISYTDYIIAHNEFDEVGCIGTMIQLSGLPKYHKDPDSGAIYCRVYASQSEEKNLDYEAALEGDVTVIREQLLDPLCERFIDDIKHNRPNVREDQVHGKIYFAKDAVGTLIDAIGTLDDAVAKVIELSEKKNKSTSSKMEKYPNLTSIPELKEQVFAEDGSTVLQECQIVAIEAALTNPAPEADSLREQIKTLKADHQLELSALADEVSKKEAQIKEKDARIDELQKALDAAIEKNNGEEPASVQVDADPSNTTKDEFAPAQTRKDAIETCKRFLEKR